MVDKVSELDDRESDEFNKAETKQFCVNTPNGSFKAVSNLLVPFFQVLSTNLGLLILLPYIAQHFIPHRATAQGMEENVVVGPISTNTIAAAEGALRWISKVPGGNKAQVRIRGALEAIKGLTMASSHDMMTLRRLEYHVWYFTELLEPFAVMHRSEITLLLQSEVELATASLKMKLIAAPDQAPRQKSLCTRPHEEHGSNAPDIRVFTQDVRSALDQFCKNALPPYTISPIKATLLPLGLISNSLCALLPFIDWILKYERAMEYRIGAMHTIQCCHRLEHALQRGWNPMFILIRLENGRQIENWLKIEGEGIVTFGTTKESLCEGLGQETVFRILGDTLLVTQFAQEIDEVYSRNRQHGGTSKTLMDSSA
ncbi:hypothetical protein BS47DRAFT_1369324 [Hydnum rufescens UP504]|uniref:Uncharacterized protein n=1 Tax=Hydnum rufescens UP504 TaxID=1448309 RepID=A0A9P6ADI7_9AGAM|nr:hypothetical protein BS47DRAFT_1369324 [Hydnum rufescens UP504]